MNAASVVLVTGGTGLIGARVVHALQSHGVSVVAYDRSLRPDRLGSDAERVQLVSGDVTGAELLSATMSTYAVTHVIHLGAILTLEAERDPIAAITANNIGTATVFDVSARHGVRRVVFAGSTGMYGTRRQYERLLGRAVVDEEDPVMPTNLYVATKMLNEVLARTYRRRGIDIVGLRPVLTYGEGVFTTAAGIINKALHDLATTQRAAVGDPWARDSRINVMHVDDCADLFARLCLASGALRHDVYNAGTGEYASIGEMLEQAASTLGGGTVDFESTSTDGASSVGVPLYDFPDVDSSRVRSELGWTPKFDFAAGARAVMAAATRE